MLGLNRPVPRVVDITGVLCLFKRTLNWTPKEPAQATFQSVFIGYDRDLVCSEIWVRASLCVITYFEEKKERCISFCEGVLSCMF